MARTANPCVCCGRTVSETALEEAIVEGYDISRCVIARDCFQHWPEADRSAVLRALFRERQARGLFSAPDR